MSNAVKPQSLFFKGIYEFEDPSGALLCAKIPASGSIDLYKGTAVVVQPTQCALFVYKGKVADTLYAGTHTMETDNVPILTRLANWSFGLQSPLRAELYYFSGQQFTARRWGTPQPFIANIDKIGPMPFRAFGTYTVSVSDPQDFFMKLVGTRSVYSITDLEEFVQSQILELLPAAFASFNSIEKISTCHSLLGRTLETRLMEILRPYGVEVQGVQVISALPTQEIMQAMESKSALQMIGNSQEYLMYKAASSLGGGGQGASDPLQVMMGLMMTKSLGGAAQPTCSCLKCQAVMPVNSKFCPQCGTRF